VSDPVARAARAARERGSAKTRRRRERPVAGSMDVFGGEVRRRDVVPMLVLHLIRDQPGYGNRLIVEIEAMTDGILTVNPNTIYPLLRELEGRGMIEGRWEHPDRRTRRYYSITATGRREYRRLVAELEPFLDSVIRSLTLIKKEVYGDGDR
jgi:DNA-binding PadR family transcriptional regulator